jgi:hypothetical protein
LKALSSASVAGEMLLDIIWFAILRNWWSKKFVKALSIRCGQYYLLGDLVPNSSMRKEGYKPQKEDMRRRRIV